jgi:hypothetical protein
MHILPPHEAKEKKEDPPKKHENVVDVDVSKDFVKGSSWATNLEWTLDNYT